MKQTAVKKENAIYEFTTWFIREYQWEKLRWQSWAQ